MSRCGETPSCVPLNLTTCVPPCSYPAPLSTCPQSSMSGAKTARCRRPWYALARLGTPASTNRSAHPPPPCAFRHLAVRSTGGPQLPAGKPLPGRTAQAAGVQGPAGWRAGGSAPPGGAGATAGGEGPPQAGPSQVRGAASLRPHFTALIATHQVVPSF